ncbi:MAG TPA: YggS family pyridoxal phosphate-dependent enzyme [Armatimonadota bacterium]|nr:YggS family pyridoxal phosphate-dependent enzyme [Armatimonadota bacterium]HPP74042.1 YggS family pyridoxal phosphate-dependent enzyme [Armatimonadota bacterium]
MARIAENLAEVKGRIAQAARRSGRTPEDVTLVVVTKKVEVSRILEAISAGATELGENYVQEAVAKWQAIGSAGVRWHFIGHLQKNKVKQAVKVFDLIQSVDSLPLAQEIGKRALDQGRIMDVLIEVRISGEETKHGVSPEDALAFAQEVAQVEGIKLQGFMGMAPFVVNPEEARPFFARLKQLWDKLPLEQRQWLSMGMSHDFEVAIEEGSNMVRIGTAILGPRS